MRLLLVTPEFHGYWRSIADAFERRGVLVASHVYDARDRVERVRHKVTSELPQRLGRPSVGSDVTTPRAVAALRQHQPDAVLVIKGDILGEAFWTELSTFPRRALWLYDELRRTQHSGFTLDLAGPIATYSASDAATLQDQGRIALHVPLAYDPHRPTTAVPGVEITFIGARYPNRESLLRTIQEAGIPVRAYGRDWSGHITDRLRTWRVSRPGVPSSRDLPRAHAYAVMAGSPATLNIHGDQDGFTMRTFEAAGVGAVELIDRPDVAALYEPGLDVAVYTCADEAVDLARRSVADPRWAKRLRESGRRRTLADHTFDHRAATLAGLLT